MNREICEKLTNRPIKLVKKDGFVLYGKILSVFNNCICFNSKGKTSYIAFERILELVPDTKSQKFPTYNEY